FRLRELRSDIGSDPLPRRTRTARGRGGADPLRVTADQTRSRIHLFVERGRTQQDQQKLQIARLDDTGNGAAQAIAVAAPVQDRTQIGRGEPSEAAPGPRRSAKFAL